MLAHTFWESDIRLTSLNSESKFAKNPCEYPVTSHPSQYLLGMLFTTRTFHAAAYLQMTDMNDQYHLGFVMGKTKLAPQAGHSIPSLELCGAVLATEIGQFVARQLDILPSKMKYFIDSKVVLGYIMNKTRRFYTYVSNRVSLIQQFTSCDQWNYVPSHLNPVDASEDFDSLHKCHPLHDEFLSFRQDLAICRKTVNALTSLFQDEWWVNRSETGLYVKIVDLSTCTGRISLSFSGSISGKSSESSSNSSLSRTIIVPKGHVATLLIRHFHEKTFHQGRKITEGEIRSNGFWIIGAKRLISTLIRTCVLCRKLRSKVEVQKMADLPEDRLTPGPQR
jgi:hypothetical protein